MYYPLILSGQNNFTSRYYYGYVPNNVRTLKTCKYSQKFLVKVLLKPNTKTNRQQIRYVRIYVQILHFHRIYLEFENGIIQGTIPTSFSVKLRTQLCCFQAEKQELQLSGVVCEWDRPSWLHYITNKQSPFWNLKTLDFNKNFAYGLCLSIVALTATMCL